MPLDDFKQLVANSKTYSEILAYWGFDNKGYNFRTLKARIAEENIDDTHISSVSVGQKVAFKTGRNIEEYLVIDGPSISGQELKRKLINSKFKLDICEECGQGPIWNNKPLTLQLDHINGNRADNRIENLRIMCPHCHTQTPTFAGRNCGHAKPKNVCTNCSTEFNNRFKHCPTCSTWRNKPRPSRHKVTHPTAEELRTLVWSKPLTQLAKDLGVSDSAIHKWCRQLGVEKPPKGYFQVGVPVKKSA
jgi:hypothetical protein